MLLEEVKEEERPALARDPNRSPREAASLEYGGKAPARHILHYSA
jgi:hypothetical protein